MSAVAPDFQQLVELASRLSPGEQLRLVARIRENVAPILSGRGKSELPSGSAAVILEAMRDPPHLSDDDVNELERAIATGRQPARMSGVFEGTDDA